jgi:hypothetical protein
VILISTLILTSSDDRSAVPSTEIYGEDKKTYINTGSGNVFKLEWELAPAWPNDSIDHFTLIIKRYDPTLNTYYNILSENIGLVYSFFVKSSMLPSAPEQYMLSIYVVAHGVYGSVATSNVISPYVSKGSGTYINIEDERYKQSIMKRSIAFVNAPTPVEPEAELIDITGRNLFAANIEEPLAAKATKLLVSSDWTIVQDGYTKDANGNWQTNDIKYEVLVAEGGDDDYEIIEVIVGRDASNKPIYEPLYVL